MMDPADAGMDNPPETASDDLIERLRGSLQQKGVVDVFLANEVASRLAALQQRVEELEAELARLRPIAKAAIALGEIRDA
jgi:hypothetical protein